MLYHQPPENFKPKFEIVSAYLEYEGKILLLHRHEHKLEGGKWGAPAGKVDIGEGKEEAMIREVKEETSYEINSDSLKYLGKVYVRYPDYDFIYHTFKVNLAVVSEIILSAGEHQGYIWLEPEKALELDLVRDMEECIKMHYEDQLNSIK